MNKKVENINILNSTNLINNLEFCNKNLEEVKSSNKENRDPINKEINKSNLNFKFIKKFIF